MDGAGWGGRLHASEKRIELKVKVSYPVRNLVAASLGTGSSRPRGAVDSGPAALESAAASVVALTCGLSVLLVGLDACEVRLCGPCAFVRPRVPCVSRLPPVSFYR